ncbi:MAG: preprotein translocase subunit YajC [Bdellovibrionales bacterium]|nr:preprotein translocase subunit YajC [Bdellovibrionales bacterium]
MLWIFLMDVAHAQEAASSAAKPNLLETMMPFLMMFGVIYFLILRPQSKRNQAQKVFLSSLKKGDSVLTSSGILGSIEGLTDKFVTLEIANNVRVRILRSQIAGPAQQQEDQKS